jgi:hypothetical protein
VGASPAAAQSGRRRGRAGMMPSPWGPHASESGRGGGKGATVDGGMNRSSAGKDLAAGGPVLGQRVGVLAQGGAGEPRGGLNLARGG